MEKTINLVEISQYLSLAGKKTKACFYTCQKEILSARNSNLTNKRSEEPSIKVEKIPCMTSTFPCQIKPASNHFYIY